MRIPLGSLKGFLIIVLASRIPPRPQAGQRSEAAVHELEAWALRILKTICGLDQQELEHLETSGSSAELVPNEEEE